MATLDYFTVTSAGIGAIDVDYVDTGVTPDEHQVYAFVDFIPREKPGTVHWCSTLSPPRGIQLDTVRGRFDAAAGGALCTIVGGVGVQLVANTAVLELGTDADGHPVDLVYDVVFTIPDLDPAKADRVISPFAFNAPRAAGVTIDLANASLHLPPKPKGWN